MNNRPLKMKLGDWYHCERYVPAQPGVYRAKVRGIHEQGWVYFDGIKFGLFCFVQLNAYGFREHNVPGRDMSFRGLVKVGYEH